MTTTTLVILWTERHYDTQAVDVIRQTERAMQIRNCDTGRQAWIPRSGLRQYVPGTLAGVARQEADECEKVVADWFRRSCSHAQMAALGFAE